MLLLLLLAGVPMSERDLYGRTPLHIAVEAQAYACAAFLLQVRVTLAHSSSTKESITTKTNTPHAVGQVGENPLVEDKFARSVGFSKSKPPSWSLHCMMH